MDAIRQSICEILEEIQPATVRQTFYQLVRRRVIAKTEGEYKQTVARLLTAMRRAGKIPFGWIADNTRWMRKPVSYAGLVDILERQREFYRRVAVTRDQIQGLKLPTRPTKESDSRSRNFEGESVEVDAIPPSTLRLMVRQCIEAYIDREQLRRVQMIEKEERETLRRIASNFSWGTTAKEETQDRRPI
jgi:hypothetical protein